MQSCGEWGGDRRPRKKPHCPPLPASAFTSEVELQEGAPPGVLGPHCPPARRKKGRLPALLRGHSTPTPTQLQLSGDPWTAVIRLDIWLWPTFFTCYLPYVFNKILLPSSHAFHVIFKSFSEHSIKISACLNLHQYLDFLFFFFFCFYHFGE